ncbi:MAG: trigger factor [Eubacteriales bacterium]|nr:trigger factor [Eubacteriales bacterium]
MNVKVENVEKNTVLLEIEVEEEKFKESLQKAYLQNKGRFSVPGFRKGKVPMNIMVNYYGIEVLYEDAFNIAFPEAYEEAVKEKGLEPVDKPEIDIKQIESGKNLIFTAKVTVKPEVALGEYKGIKIKKQKVSVSKEDVDKEIAQIQKRNARIVAADDGRQIRKDDIAVIDYEGFLGEKAFEGGKGENHQLTIGSGQFIPGFEDQLIGAKTGDTVDVNVTFPKEYHSEDLAGKEAFFKVKIKEIKISQLPVLDDEFAKDVSEFDTLEEYKADMKAQLEKKENERIENDYNSEAISTVSENATIDIPPVMVEDQIDDIVKEFEMTLRYQGLDLEQYFKVTGSDEKAFRESLKERAEREVRNRLTIETISKAEKIEPSQEALEKEIEEMAANYKQKPEDFRKKLREEDIAYLKESLKFRDTVKFIVQNAVIK